MKTIAFMLLFTLVAFIQGCGAPMVYYVQQKEKVIERNAPPGAGHFTDRFLYKRAHGQANVVWIVDNTTRASEMFDHAPGVEGNFQKGYRETVEQLGKRPGPFEHVNIRHQLVASPSGRMPANFYGTDGSNPLHMKEAFNLPKNFSDLHGFFISNADSRRGELREWISDPNPFASAERGVQHEAFKNRQNARTYFVFALGSRFTARLEKSKGDYVKAVSPVKPIYTVDTFHLVRSNLATCRMVRPSDFLEQSREIGWRVAPAEGDLCGDPSTWARQITEWIQREQSEMRLSFVPLSPGSLIVRDSQGRRLEFNSQFVYDAARNAIVISPTLSPPLIEGEPIDVAYPMSANDPPGAR